MKGYSSTSYFHPELVGLFERATALVAALPEPRDVDHIRCHELTRAVFIMLSSTDYDIHVVDGTYGMIDHSWLELSLDGVTHAILDCYAVGRLPMVQLQNPREWRVAGRAPSPYKAGPQRTDIDQARVRQLALTMGGRA